MERTRNIVHLLFNLLLRMVSPLLKRREYFASISVLLITEKFLAAVPYSYGQETSERVCPREKETARQWAYLYSAIATEQ
jgi:hypothetical protein